MLLRKKWIILVVLFIVAGLLIFGFFYYPQIKKINYLISGVPYYGFYNHFFDSGNSTVVTSMADILGYWGDTRFSISDLLNKFPPSEGPHTTSQIQKFFEDNGYGSYRWSLGGSEERMINRIKEFVNPEKKIPVMVIQKRSSDPAKVSVGLRVAIGIFDNEEKIIFHDYDFGNNYGISYKDFESRFRPTAQAILAVWPSDDLKAKLTGPNYNSQYPQRLEAMDNLGELLIKRSDAAVFGQEGKYEQALQLYKEFLNDPKISYLPAAHQVEFYSRLANLFLLLDKPDEAIGVITEQALLLNNNLNLAVNGWTEQVELFKGNNHTENKFAHPYYILGRAYLMKGDKALAEKNFKEVLKIYPEYIGPSQALEKLE